MNPRYLFGLLALIQIAEPVPAADWPQYRYDAGRTAATDEQLPGELHLQWVREFPSPRPAFPNEVRLRYDSAYSPVVAGGRMFVPSMVADTVTALDTETGRTLWQFFTGGPVRFAPAVWQDKVYFGSDDGYLYCVEAATGGMRWRVRGLPADREDRQLLGNGRMISLWPVRGGPVLADGRVYFAAGLWPTYGVFVYALNAETGEVVWSNTDSNQIPAANQDHGIAQVAGVTPQGYLAIAGNRLVVPCGAQLPAFLDLATGELDKYCMGWGGRVGLPKGSWFAAGVGNLLSHSGDLYDMSRTSDEKFQDPKFPVDFKSDLYAGGLQRLRLDPSNQRELGDFRRPVLTPEVMYTDENGIAAWDLTAGASKQRGELDLPAYRRNDQYPDQQEMQYPGLWRLSTKARLHIKAGSRLYIGSPGAVEAVQIPKPGGTAKTVWQGKIMGVPEQMLAANGRLFVATREGRVYAFGEARPDTVSLPEARTAEPVAADPWTQTAADILRTSGVQAGYGVVLGLNEGRLVEELIGQSDLLIVAVDQDAGKVDRLRRRLMDAGVYGVRASVYVGDPATHPLPPLMANLVVSEAVPAGQLDKVAAAVRLLRPYGGTACLDLGAPEVTLDESQTAGLSIEQSSGWTVIRRDGPLAGSADWSHPLADAANAGATEDRFLEAPLDLLWFDGAIRWHRKPGSAEVRVAGGRVVTKADKLHAVDVYTGRIMWQTTLPFGHNPTDQIVAVDDQIYVTSGPACFVVSAATGEIERRFGLPGGLPGPWQNLRIADDYIVGQGGESVFCLDRPTGNLRWQFECSRPALSIAVGGGRVYCAELVNLRRGEKEDEFTKTRALDIAAGKVQWEIVRGVKLVYSTAHDLLVTSRGIYRGVDGSLVTDTADFDQLHGNVACEVLSVVDDQVLWGTVTSFTAYNINTGDAVQDALAWVRRGCTDLRASAHLITTRYRGNCAYIDLESREITPLWNIRPACNNNLYPANGVLNIPCLTGGCECNYTPASTAYLPRALFE